MILTTNPQVISRGSKQRPVLAVVSNLGAALSPAIIIGRDPQTIQTTGTPIGPGGNSPQLTLTEELWAACAGVAPARQNIAVMEQNL